mgnify:CR=1 FL=1
MSKAKAKRNLKILITAGLPYTLIGMAVILGGIFILKQLMAGSDYLGTVLLVWLTFFWLIYQPLFRKKIRKVSENLKNS